MPFCPPSSRKWRKRSKLWQPRRQELELLTGKHPHHHTTKKCVFFFFHFLFFFPAFLLFCSRTFPHHTTCLRSSVWQSARLLIVWSWVRAPPRVLFFCSWRRYHPNCHSPKVSEQLEHGRKGCFFFFLMAEGIFFLMGGCVRIFTTHPAATSKRKFGILHFLWL